MDGGVVIEYLLWEVLPPVALTFWGKGTKQVMHCSVESLALSIPLRVVWGSAGLLDTI